MGLLMSKIRTTVYAFFALLCCSSLTLADSSPLEIQKSTRINQLNSSFLKVALGDAAPKNTMVSSVSMFYALSILEMGASGNTNALLRNLLLTKPVESQSVAKLVALLSFQLVNEPVDSDSAHGRFQLSHSVWATTGETSGLPFVLASQFTEGVRDAYTAEVHNIDFLSPGASALINKWSLDSTNGLIKDVIDDQTLQSLTWVIANTTYFEGAWANPMRKTPPSENYRFMTSDGHLLKVDSISSSQSLRVVDNDNGSLTLSIPFSGGKYYMVLQVPAKSENNIGAWLRDVAVPEQSAAIERIFSPQVPRFNVHLRMPVFSFGQRHRFLANTPATRKLGLLPLFTNAANLTNLVNTALSHPAVQETRVGLIQQDTRIELDEKGVKAAAVTVIDGMIKSKALLSFEYRHIDIDRPFVWSIVEGQSQTVLFSGVLANPLER